MNVAAYPTIRWWDRNRGWGGLAGMGAAPVSALAPLPAGSSGYQPNIVVGADGNPIACSNTWTFLTNFLTCSSPSTQPAAVDPTTGDPITTSTGQAIPVITTPPPSILPEGGPTPVGAPPGTPTTWSLPIPGAPGATATGGGGSAAGGGSPTGTPTGFSNTQVFLMVGGVAAFMLLTVFMSRRN